MCATIGKEEFTKFLVQQQFLCKQFENARIFADKSQAIRNDGLSLAGWVANVRDPDMPVLEENIATLTARLPAPCLGIVPALENPLAEGLVSYLDLSLLGL